MTQASLDVISFSAAFRIRRIGWIAVLISLCFLATAGCGRKGPPVPPQRTPLPQATELSGRLEGDTATLTWRRPAAAQGLREYAVMRAQSKGSDPACPGCPLVFQEAERITTDVDTDTFEFSERVPEGFIYTYKVQTVEASGDRGQDSNRVIIDRAR
jgi:predicted small lipoprotein YifL